MECDRSGLPLDGFPAAVWLPPALLGPEQGARGRPGVGGATLRGASQGAG